MIANQGKQIWSVEDIDIAAGEIQPGFFSSRLADFFGIAPLFMGDDKLLIHDYEGEITCLNRNTGEKIWSVGENPVSSLKLNNLGVLVKLRKGYFVQFGNKG